MHRLSTKTQISSKIPEHIYYVRSKEANSLIQLGSKAFKEFKNYQRDKRNSSSLKNLEEFHQKEIDAIDRAISFFKKAIENSTEITDKSFCERRYASVIIRKENMHETERYQLAKNSLISSIDGYQQSSVYNGLVAKIKTANFNFSQQELVIITEMQRALSALAQVALTLKDGELLQKVVGKLVQLLKLHKSTEYYRDALTHQYHLNLSQNNIPAAKECILEVINLTQKMKIPNDTDYRHLAKINLLLADGKDEEYFEKEIQKKFWPSFDKHKKFNNREDFQAKKHALLADFCMLLHIKTVQRLYGKNPKKNESVYQYIKRQIAAVFKKDSSSYKYFVTAIDHVIDDYEKTNKISLAFKLFKEIEPPYILLDKEKFALLFSDYLEMRTDSSRELTVVMTGDNEHSTKSQEKPVTPQDKPITLNPKAKTFIPQSVQRMAEPKNELAAPPTAKATLNPNAPAFIPSQQKNTERARPKTVTIAEYSMNAHAKVFTPQFFNFNPNAKSYEPLNCIYTKSNY